MTTQITAVAMRGIAPERLKDAMSTAVPAQKEQSCHEGYRA